jgi:hypothetical protein
VVTLLEAVDLERITPKHIYFNVYTSLLLSLDFKFVNSFEETPKYFEKH